MTSPSCGEIREEMSELSSSSQGEGGVFLAEGTACLKGWQHKRVCSLGLATRMESKWVRFRG